jgi:uncharacterized membrane protein
MYHWFMDLCAYICSQNPDTTPVIMGYRFFLCYRCMGIYFLFFFTLIVYSLLYRFRQKKQKTKARNIAFFNSYLLVAISCMVMAMDVFFIQSLYPNNLTRFFTGSIVGVCVAQLFFKCIISLKINAEAG